ncbi:beta-lactamase/transpeptidase-like protein [Aspergillus heteromorphus CBS 117.55]|uniref:Beta-lactamase/transpeptidase-like protein n=1 Tax=Aspergillus heteromorphus CBS 117.55 TaxID=1448321 RepID=A0A317WGK8_9EURO|nr:beta-lactamase/transpeptidase-like protein [Aspergillus heteromorphus CBS 117.55]PWY83330.1 beta-lactamase/transpeptidase-like protein [Aspergillus heteromorphus CBS 117.55]
MRVAVSLALLASAAQQALAACEPEIPFPPPQYTGDSLVEAFAQVDASLAALVAAGGFDDTSFSVMVASSDRLLHSAFHAAPGVAQPVNASSAYRIASNTKLFTALGILQAEAAGHLSLDDRITTFLPDLRHTAGRIAWDTITLRTLMAHLSGIPDNCNPPPQKKEFERRRLTQVDAEDDLLLRFLEQATPVFPARDETSYSNLGYNLLGLVLERISNTTYEEYIEATILRPLNLTGTCFTPPATGVVVADSYWGVDLGEGNPSGGLYSSATDMIAFLRFALAQHNRITPALNWFLPAAYSAGAHSYFGYPWEIFRSPAILPHSTRAVTLNTKGGGLTGYYTYSFVVPVYDLVIFLGVAGELTGLTDLLDAVVDPILVGAEGVAQRHLATTYAGTYRAPAATGLNSSLTIAQSPQRSLSVSAWVSNGTDVLDVLVPLVAGEEGSGDDIYFEFLPTFETRTTTADGAVGEVWRVINVLEGAGGDTATRGNASSIWADYCVSNIDPLTYAGVALNEMVFWRANATAAVHAVELSAFRVVLDKE